MPRIRHEKIALEVLEIIRDDFYKDFMEDMKTGVKEIIEEEVTDSFMRILDFPLTVKQAAKLTGHSEGSIYKLCYRGTIPYTKIKGLLHISLRDLNSTLIRE